MRRGEEKRGAARSLGAHGASVDSWDLPDLGGSHSPPGLPTHQRTDSHRLRRGSSCLGQPWLQCSCCAAELLEQDRECVLTQRWMSSKPLIR